MANDLFVCAEHLSYATDASDIKQADYIVVAVPTPVDDAHTPDLTPVIKASKTAGCNLKKGAIVNFESTVYPGVIEAIPKNRH